MKPLTKIINKMLSVRLSLMVVFSMGILLMGSLVVMVYFSRKAVKEEALHKASQTLEATVQRIDNILLSVEQTTGNFYYSMLPHLDNPDVVYTYSRKLVESNPFVNGCVIAFKTDFYKDHKYFMTYAHRRIIDGMESEDIDDIEVVTSYDGGYTEQMWFTRPMSLEIPGWQKIITGEGKDEIPIITFCLFLTSPDGSPIGVMGVSVSLKRLSNIIAEVKPSANSYCTLLDADGTYLVHPNIMKLLNQTPSILVGKDADPSAKEAAEAMVSGKTGYMPFRMNGTDYYVFYKPFMRSAITGRTMEPLGWSAGIVYPEDDIFGEYNMLSVYVLAIAVVGLLLLFVLSRAIIHRQLKPLLMLTASAQRIADGNYDEIIPDSRQEDEIGRLQDNFRQMQQSLSAHIGELDHLTTTLHERSEGLREAYKQAQKAERMKVAFLHNMSNQMIGPAEAIERSMRALAEKGSGIGTNKDISRESSSIQENGNTMAELLNNLIIISDEDRRKEDVDV